MHNGNEKRDFFWYLESQHFYVKVFSPFCSYFRENTLQIHITYPVIRAPDVSGQCSWAHGVIFGVSYTGSAVGLDDPDGFLSIHTFYDFMILSETLQLSCFLRNK